MEIWCNEAQERYVLAISAEDEAIFSKICERERCPFAIVGEATDDHKLTLVDSHFDNNPIDIDMSILLGKHLRCFVIALGKPIPLKLIIQKLAKRIYQSPAQIPSDCE